MIFILILITTLDSFPYSNYNSTIHLLIPITTPRLISLSPLIPSLSLLALLCGHPSSPPLHHSPNPLERWVCSFVQSFLIFTFPPHSSISLIPLLGAGKSAPPYPIIRNPHDATIVASLSILIAIARSRCGAPPYSSLSLALSPSLVVTVYQRYRMSSLPTVPAFWWHSILFTSLRIPTNALPTPPTHSPSYCSVV